jgi:hypothetical protein
MRFLTGADREPYRRHRVKVGQQETGRLFNNQRYRQYSAEIRPVVFGIKWRKNFGYIWRNLGGISKHAGNDHWNTTNSDQETTPNNYQTYKKHRSRLRGRKQGPICRPFSLYGEHNSYYVYLHAPNGLLRSPAAVALQTS